jgi:L-rhamnose mutarotase
MDCRAALIRLKPGSLERVREWARTINQRQDEALATLRNEDVSVESWFLLSREDGDYLLSYMRCEDFDRAFAAVKESLHEIDAYHKQFMQDTCERGGQEELELLVDLAVERKT